MDGARLYVVILQHSFMKRINRFVNCVPKVETSNGFLLIERLYRRIGEELEGDDMMCVDKLHHVYEPQQIANLTSITPVAFLRNLEWAWE